jgi:alginate O-acetyltransferase complex protein AlgJ
MKTRKRIPLAAFALVMLAAAPVNLAFLANGAPRLVDAPVTLDDLLRGKTAEALTARYNDSSPFREAGIEGFGALSWLAFGEARGAARVGVDGTLFTTEEFETDPGSQARVEAALDRIAAVSAHLEARGVKLIVAPLPLKADILAASLGGVRPAPELVGRYDRVLDGLQDRGVARADLRSAFRAAPDPAALFLRNDTHWTPNGAAVAARAISDALAFERVPGEVAVTLTREPATDHTGDLAKFVRLPALLAHLGPQPEPLAGVRAEIAGGDLFGDAAIHVALVGTSYSADARFGFEAHLKAALSRDVLNLSEEGKGPFAPMQAFLDGEMLRDAPPRVVIWEMPIRYLDDVAAPLALPSGSPLP